MTVRALVKTVKKGNYSRTELVKLVQRKEREHLRVLAFKADSLAQALIG